MLVLFTYNGSVCVLLQNLYLPTKGFSENWFRNMFHTQFVLQYLAAVKHIHVK
jgi:hypothetical protein